MRGVTTERHTLKLTAHSTSGVGHLGLRVRDGETLERLVADLAARNIVGVGRGHRARARVREWRRPTATPSNCAETGASRPRRRLRRPSKPAAAVCASRHRAAAPRSRQPAGARRGGHARVLPGASRATADRADHPGRRPRGGGGGCRPRTSHATWPSRATRPEHPDVFTTSRS